jgi:RimJ/RimL family protein N-acetyltransferase
LVPLALDDAEEMVGVLADPALYAFVGGEPPTFEDLRRRYRRQIVGRSDDGGEAWHNWIVRLASDGRAVGTVQATVSNTEPEAEVAWVIGVPWQGLGYASEAARALLGWLEGAGVTVIIARIHPQHGASNRVATPAGLMPSDEIEDGERVWRRQADR